MGADKPSGTRVTGAIRHQDAATYLRWMQFEWAIAQGQWLDE